MPIQANGVIGRIIGSRQVSSPLGYQLSISNSRCGLLQIIHAYHGFTLIKTDRVYSALILFVCPVVNWLRMEKAGILRHPAFNQFLGSDATDTYLVMPVCYFNMISEIVARVVPAKRKRAQHQSIDQIFSAPSFNIQPIGDHQPGGVIRHTGDNGAG